MPRFSGFRVEQVSAFALRADEAVEAERRCVTGCLGQLLKEVERSLVSRIDGLMITRPATFNPGERTVSATIERRRKDGTGARFSFKIDGSFLYLGLLIAGKDSFQVALEKISSNREAAFAQINQLSDFDLLLERRRRYRRLLFARKRVYSLALDRIVMLEINSLIEKMKDLERYENDIGELVLIFERSYPFDAKELRDGGFARFVTRDIGRLVPVMQFLGGDAGGDRGSANQQHG